MIARSNGRTAALALAALILYPFAVGMPMLRVMEFGHASEASILEGVSVLLRGGHILVGIVVLLCSVILPVGKLLALLAITSGSRLMQARHRALTHRVVEWTGRWGMLDVLLVAILVALVKLGDTVQVEIGPAALAFASCVVLNLLAAACFDPHTLWEADA